MNSNDKRYSRKQALRDQIDRLDRRADPLFMRGFMNLCGFFVLNFIGFIGIADGSSDLSLLAPLAFSAAIGILHISMKNFDKSADLEDESCKLANEYFYDIE